MKWSWVIKWIAFASAVVLLSLVIYSMVMKNDHGIQQPVLLSAAERTWLKEHEIITIGADPMYPPIDYIENGNHTGLAEDYIKLIEGRLNVRFKRVNPTSWRGLLEDLRSRKIDIIKSADNTEERRKYLLFTSPIIIVPTVIITRKSIRRDYTLPELKGLRIGVTGDYAVHEIVRREYPELGIIPVKNDEIGLRMASEGSLDVMISDLPTSSYLIEKTGITNLRVAGETGLKYHLSIGSRSDWPVLHDILVKALDSISRDEQERITAKWIKLEYNRYLYSRSFWTVLTVTLGLVMLAAGIVLLWNKSLHVLVRERTRELDKYKDELENLVEERTRELTETNNTLKETNDSLRVALSNVKTLSGLLPICSNCKKIRNDTGYWEQIESYIMDHSDADFSHSLCPECAEKIYGIKPGGKIS